MNFGFPQMVNEKAARLIAGGVAIIAILGLATGWDWLLIVLAAGFLLRVCFGPKASPLGLIVVKFVAPRTGKPTIVPGPPKRFAQTIGAVTTLAGTILVFVFGVEVAAPVVFAIMAVFATLESVFGLCVGCKMFAVLMRLGVIPDDVCEACADISLRRT